MVCPCVFCRCWCCPNTHRLVRLLRLNTPHMIIHATSRGREGICGTPGCRRLLGDLGRHGNRGGRRGDVCRGWWVLSGGVTRGRLRGRGEVVRRGMVLGADRHQRRRCRGLRSLLIRREVRRMMGLFQEPGGRRSRRWWSNWEKHCSGRGRCAIRHELETPGECLVVALGGCEKGGKVGRKERQEKGNTSQAWNRSSRRGFPVGHKVNDTPENRLTGARRGRQMERRRKEEDAGSRFAPAGEQKDVVRRVRL